MGKMRERVHTVLLVGDKADCCGCGACFTICPANAISMVPDTKGFVYPIIDESKCIGCRKCTNICILK